MQQTKRAKSLNAIKRHRTARLARLATRAYYLHRRGRDEEMSTLICNEFVNLGGVYVKFLQGVMLHSELMKKWHNPERLKIFENLDQEPLDIMRILQHELSPEQLQQITMVQPQPFAAGSFGQVYYGQHVNGKPIIIKVLRPMIRELLRYDLRLISRFARSFCIKLYKNMQVNIDQAIKEFTQSTLRETDYIEEAHFAAELYNVYKGNKYFIIPETFLELCTPHIIVQEYISGLSVAQVMKMQEQGVDPKTYVAEQTGSDLDVQLQILGIESLGGIFKLRRVQGDPHPGNIRLLSQNRVGLIDFGISAHSPKNKGAFFGMIEEWNRLYTGDQNIANLFEQFIRFFVNDLYKSLKKLASYSGNDGTETDYTREVGRIAQETFSKVIGTADIQPLIEDGRILQIINRVVNKENRFGLVMKLEATEILRAAQTYITLVETLGRRNAVMPKVFTYVVNDVRKNHPDILHQGEDTTSIADALEVVSSWLERVAERDPLLFQQLVHKIRMGRKNKDFINV
jgi:hypothetical protein